MIRFLPKKCTIFFGGLIVFLLYWWITGDVESSKKPTVTVFAAASMTDALLEAGAVFEEQYDCSVRFSFASSSTLARQIAAGASADIFISANTQWMDFLEEHQDIVAETRDDLLENRIVGIVPSTERPFATTPEAWLKNIKGRIAMADPTHVPAGIYGKQALEQLGLWRDVNNILIPTVDTRAAVYAVELGECAGGIVYASDAVSTQNVRVAVRFDEDHHEPVRYPVALCKNATQSGEPFLEFLYSDTARAFFQKNGFKCLGKNNEHLDSNPPYYVGFNRTKFAAAKLSMQVAACSVLVLLVPGIVISWILSRFQFPGKGLLEALLYMPMVMPPVITGYVLLLLLGKQGLIGARIEALFGVRISFTLWAAVIAASVMAFPLMVRSVRIAIELVNSEYEEAAAMSGAGPFLRFITVILPLAGPGILAGLVLAFSRSLGEFGATMIFAGNIPGETQTIPLAIYTALQRPGGEGMVMHLAVLSISLSMGALYFSQLLEKRLRNSEAPL